MGSQNLLVPATRMYMPSCLKFLFNSEIPICLLIIGYICSKASSWHFESSGWGQIKCTNRGNKHQFSLSLWAYTDPLVITLERSRAIAYSSLLVVSEKSMSTKMKGLLKGLRYISQIFENEQEPEMQIGMPTDVKHVAHIGWDGPTANAPAWMNQYKPDMDPTGLSNDQFHSNSAAGSQDSRPPTVTDQRRVSTGSESASESPSTRRRSDKKSSRRHNSGGSSTADSPNRSTDGSRRLPNSNLGPVADSPSRDSPAPIPKSSRRKKSKALSGGGGAGSPSTRSRVNDAGDQFPYSDPGLGGHGSGSREGANGKKSKGTRREGFE